MMDHISGQMVSLADIADRAAVPIERVRYVIDSGILQGGRQRKRGTGPSNPGRGIPRAFTRDKAFALVTVNLMLEAGIRPRTIQDCLQLLSASLVPGSRRLRDLTLIRVLSDQAVVALEIWDGLNIRLVVHDGARAIKTSLPTGWIQPKTGVGSRTMIRCWS
jgi:hypothetical protein